MTSTTAPAPTKADGRVVVLGGRHIPIVLPRRSDPRLRVSAVILTIQALGQTVLDFKVSIAQILVTIGVCAAIEVAITYRREAVLAWPASAILTGSGIAFILRASGTRHGDFWSLHGIEYFVLAAVLALLSKHLIRPGGRHLFNPANVALVWVLLVIGPTRVFPQYLWWGPWRGPVVAAMAVILVGAVWVLRPVRMAPMAIAFLATFAALVSTFAWAGRSYVAIWRDGPIDGADYALTVLASPELLIFAFFMMSDPQTAPRTSNGRVVYGVSTALVAAALVYPQGTEFGIKVGILASLTVLCALVPLIEAATSGPLRHAPWANAGLTQPGKDRRPTAAAGRRPAIVAAIIIAVAAPLNAAALADDQELILIERGLTDSRNPQ